MMDGGKCLTGLLMTAFETTMMIIMAIPNINGKLSTTENLTCMTFATVIGDRGNNQFEEGMFATLSMIFSLIGSINLQPRMVQLIRNSLIAIADRPIITAVEKELWQFLMYRSKLKWSPLTDENYGDHIAVKTAFRPLVSLRNIVSSRHNFVKKSTSATVMKTTSGHIMIATTGDCHI